MSIKHKQYTLSPKEFAQLTGVSPSTVRRWEDEGIFKSMRTVSGYRRYSLSDIPRAKEYKSEVAEIKRQKSQRHVYSVSHNRFSLPPVVLNRVRKGSPINKNSLILAVVALLISASFIFGASVYSAQKKRSVMTPSQQHADTSGKESENVLAAETTRAVRSIISNIGWDFRSRVQIQELQVNGESIFLGDIDATDQNLTLGNGQLTASNVIYSLDVGDGLDLTGGRQNPVITNTGVLSFNGLTGQLEFKEGTGINIDGLEITNNDPGSAQKIFKNIKVGSTTITAGSNEDTLTLEEGAGVTLTANGKTITISNSLTGYSGWDITVDGSVADTVDDAESVDFVSGNDINVTRTAENELTFDIQDVLDTVLGINLPANGYITGSNATITFDNFSVDASGNILIASGANLSIGSTLLSGTGPVSGATLIGVDGTNISQSASGDLQTVLENISAAVGSGSSKWTIETGTIFPSDYVTVDFALGGTTPATASFGIAIDENIVYIGDGSNDSNTPQILFKASDSLNSGSISFADGGSFVLSGGDLSTDGIIYAGSGTQPITLASGFLNPSSIPLITSGTTTTLNSISGLEVVNNQIGLIRGCSEGQVLKWNATTNRWTCGTDSSGVSGVVDVQEDGAIPTGSTDSQFDTINFVQNFSLVENGSGIIDVNLADKIGIGATPSGTHALYVNGSTFLSGLITLNAGFNISGATVTSLTGAGLTVNGSNALALTNTGVVSGTYGSATGIPVLSVDSQGRLITAGTQPISYDNYNEWVGGAGGVYTNVGSGSTVVFAGGTGIGVTNTSGTFTITNTGVTSLTGTTNQVNVSQSTGGVTLTLPQSIDTGAAVEFGSLRIAGSTAVSSVVAGVSTDWSGASDSEVATRRAIKAYVDAQVGGATLSFSNGLMQSGTMVTFGGEILADTRLYSGGTELAYFDTSGNIGIGTTDTGTYRLRVEGTGYFNSLLTLNSGLSINGVIVTTLTGTGLTVSGGSLRLTDTGVVSGTYGSGTSIPIFQVDAQGRLTVAGTQPISYDNFGSWILSADSTTEAIGTGDTVSLTGLSGIGVTHTAGSLTITSILGTSIESTEITDNTITTADIAQTLTFASGDYLDLTAINYGSTAPQGLRLPNATTANLASYVPSTGPGLLAYDTDAGKIKVFNGSNWVDISGASTTLQESYVAGNSVSLTAAEGDIRFYNDNSDEIIFFDESSGYVGVGSTAPGYKLDVNGDIRISSGSDLYFGSTGIGSTGGAAYIGVNSAGFENSTSSTLQNVLQDLDDAIGGVSGSAISAVGNITSGDAFTSLTPGAELYFTSGSFLGLGNTASSAGRIEFYDSAVDRIALLSANVGIGTTSPVEKLDVQGGIRLGNAGGPADVLNTLASGTNPSGDLYWGSYKICTTGSSCAGGAGGGVDSAGSSNYIPLFNDQYNIINSILYQSGGNIGLGTTDTSTYKLRVEGTGYFNSLLTLNAGFNISGATVTSLTGAGLTINGSNALTLTNTGVVAGTYGSAVSIPVLSVDAQGRLITAGTQPISYDNYNEWVGGAGGVYTNVGSGSTVVFAGGTGIGVTNTSGTFTITNTGVTSLTGTTNQVNVSQSTGGVTLTLPQSIDTGAAVEFGSLRIAGSTAVSSVVAGVSTDWSGASDSEVATRRAIKAYVDAQVGGATLSFSNGLMQSGTMVTFGGEILADTRLYTGGTELFYIDQGTGNIGIGTTSTPSLLTLSGSDGTTYSSAQLQIIEPNSSKSLYIGTANDAYGVLQTAGGVPFILNPAGNDVGIGTSNTALITERLSIFGGGIRIDAGEDINWYNSSTRWGGVEVVGVTGALSLDTVGTASVYIDTNNNSNDAFQVHGNVAKGSSSGVLFKVQDDGNVGIGTTSPSYKLDISGSARIASGSDLFIGSIGLGLTGSSNNTSGASLIGAFDEFDNSNSSNVQDILDDLDASITSSTHDAVTLAGSYDYLTLSGQQITLNQIDLTTDITGTLPTGNGGTGLTSYTTGDMLYASDSSTFGKLGIGANGYILTSNGTAPVWQSLANANIVAGTGTSGYVSLWNGTNSIGDSRIYQSGNNIGIGGTNPVSNPGIYVASNGNVGIGTTSPTSMLQLAGNIDLTSNGNIYNIDNIYSEGTGSWGRITIANGISIGYQSGDYIDFTQEGASEARLINGKLGIGEVSPGSRLSVSGGATIGVNYDTLVSPSNGLLVEGNVGIGTTNPSYKLDVNGSARIASGSDLFIGTIGLGATGSSNTTSGASLIGAFDEFDYSSSSTVQGVLNDLDSQIGTLTGSSHSAVTLAGPYDYLTLTGQQITLNQIDLTTDVTATLPTGNGGTGLTSYTTGDMLYASDSSTLSKLGIGANGYILTSNGTAPVWQSLASANIVSGTGTSGYVSLWNGTNSIGDSTIYQTGGNVGIGTTSPSSKLDLTQNNGNTSTTNSVITLGNIAASLFGDAFSPNNTPLGGIDWYNGDTSMGAGVGASIRAYATGSFGGGTEIRINTKSEGGNLNEKIRITSNGNIGIGTTSPTSLLDVAGTGWIRGGTGSNTGLFVASGGNVGIGLTNPSYTLDVNGSARIASGSDLFIGTIGLGATGSSNTTSGASLIGAFDEFEYSSSSTVQGVLNDLDSQIGTLTSSSHSAVTLAGSYDYLTLSGQQITLNQIDLTTDVTGTLPTGNGGTGLTTYTAGDMLYASDSSTLSKLGIGANGYILTSNGTAPVWQSLASANIVSGTGTSGYVSLWNGTNSLGDSRIYQSGNNIGIGGTNPVSNPGIYVASNGNVGIGTTSPTSMLQLAGNIDLTSNGNIYNIDNIYSEGTGSWGRITIANGISIGYQSGDYIDFTQEGASEARLINGKLGIGEVSPGSRLSVSGGATIGVNYDTLVSPSNGLLVEGNVGIGTTNPSYKLDVNGSARIASGSDLFIGTIGLGATGSSNTTSGASLIGAFDEFDYSSSSTVQGVLNDLDSQIGTLTSSSHSAVTLAGSYDYLTLSGQQITLNQIDLSTDVTGTLPTGNGGTGLTSYTTGDMLYASDSSTLSKLGIGANGYILTSNGTAPVWQSLASANIVSGTGTSGYVSLWNGTNSLGDSRIYQSGNNIGIGGTNPVSNPGIYVASDGNVGIGTTNPMASFHVKWNASIFGGDPYTDASIELNSNSDRTSIEGHSKIGSRWSIGTIEDMGNDNFTLMSTSNTDIILATGVEENVRIKYGGRVGIGTNSPTDKLDIAGGAKIGAGYAGIGKSAPENGLLVEGNVGIGTTNPSYKLDVNGSARIASGSDLFIGTIGLGATGSSNTTSGASLIGAFDEFDYSSSSTVQGVLNDLDSQIGTLTSSSHSAVTLAGSYDYLTLSGQQITLNQIDLSTDVTGTLPTGNGGTGLTSYTTGDMLYASDSSTLSKLGIGANGYILTSNGTAPVWQSLASANIVSGTGTSGYVSLWNGTNSLGDSRIYQSGNNIGIGGTNPVSNPGIYVASDGNVGIGTTNPMASFHVKWNASIFGGDPYTDASIELNSNSDRTSIEGHSKIGSRWSIGTIEDMGNDNFTLMSTSNTDIILATGVEENVRIKYGGRVGIGTNSPTDKLDIAGGAKIGAGYAGIGKSAPENGLLVEGNVGIGTTNPSYKLDVNGSARIASGSDLFIGTIGLGATGSSNTTSGASLIGAFDEFDYSSSSTVQGVLNDLDSQIGTLTSSSHSAVTLAGSYDYLTLSGQQITLNQIDLSTDVTGTLPTGNGGTGLTSYTTGDMLYASDSSTLSKLGIGANGYILTSNGTAPVWQSLASANIVSGTGTSGYVSLWNGTNSLGDSRIYQSGNNIGIGGTNPVSNPGIYVASDGNVGIGTTNPMASFHVKWNASIFGGDPYTDASIELNSNSDRTSIEGHSKIGSRWSIGTIEDMGNDNFTLMSTSNTDIILATGVEENVRIKYGGRVGIGTNSPTDKLDIAGGAKIGAGYAGIGKSAPENGLLVEGNVGIGTTNPSYKLDVNGSARIASGSDLFIGTIGLGATGSSNTTSGASLIGAFDEFDYSSSSTVQGVLNDLDSQIGTLTSSSHSAVTLAGSYDYLTLSGQQITLNQIDLSTDVTGTLPTGNGGTGLTSYTTGDMLYASDSSTLSKLGIGANGYILTSNGTAPVWQSLASANIVSGTGTSGYVSLWNGTNSLGDSRIYQSGNNIGIGGTNPVSNPGIYVASNGNVGIGTTSPGSALGVNGDVMLTNGSNRTISVEFTSGGIGKDLSIAAGGGSSSGGNLFLKGGATVNGAGNVYLQGGYAAGSDSYANVYLGYDGGYIGIGTTSPTHKLELVSHTTAAGGIGFGTDVELYRGAANRLDLASGDSLNLVAGGLLVSGTETITSGRLIRVADGTVGAPSYSFTNSTNSGIYMPSTAVLGIGTSGVERIRILADGNVGIGTTSPVARLDVAGTSWLRGGTGNNTGLFVNSSGNVGIGTTAPGAALSIYNLSAFKNNGYLGLGTTNPVGLLHIDGSNLDAVFATTGYLGIGTTNASTPLEIFGTSAALQLSYDATNYGKFTIGNDGTLTLAGVSSGGSLTNIARYSTSQINFDVPTAFNAAGDVSVAYDLYFTNQTASYIKTDGPLTIQSGEAFESNDLTLETYGSGDIILKARGGNLWADGTTVGIGTTAPARTLHVQTTADEAPVRFQDLNGYCEINPTTTTWSCTSDATLKKNIQTLSSISNLEKLNALRPVSFEWKTQKGDTQRFGFIAQEVEKIFPEFVQTDVSGLKTVSYGSFTPIIISALQEQQLTISTQQSNLAALNEQLDLTIDEVTGNATGTLIDSLAQNSFDVEIRTTDLESSVSALAAKDMMIENRLESIEDRLDVLEQASAAASLDTLNDRIGFIEQIFTDLQASGSADLSSYLANLIDGQVLGLNSEDATASALTVTGDTNLNNLAVTGEISSGLLTINGFDDSLATPSATISTLGGSLKLQHLGLGEIEFMAGKSKIDTDGNFTLIEGDLIVETGVIKGNDQIRGIDLAVELGETSLEVFFDTLKDTDEYAVNITPSWLTNLAVTEKRPDGFIIEFSKAAPIDAKLDWVIIE